MDCGSSVCVSLPVLQSSKSIFALQGHLASKCNCCFIHITMTTPSSFFFWLLISNFSYLGITPTAVTVAKRQQSLHCFVSPAYKWSVCSFLASSCWENLSAPMFYVLVVLHLTDEKGAKLGELCEVFLSLLTLWPSVCRGQIPQSPQGFSKRAEDRKWISEKYIFCTP